ncbi:hypothetical protein HBF26_17235 [Luteibacter jiangsuensis]|uniref:Bacteriophage Rz lysis protein n=1 Tax=Luteibacter jiangsuensis TaxID=637577 RepID=A0ABX0QAY2_9GAMM|nr:hypothetical protein [Luteibacter jiangsuensis]NID06642.1 hypothetical protein [Luteibacter jiangsuensis]
MNAWAKVASYLVALAMGFSAGWYVRSEGARADLAEANRDRAAEQTGWTLASAQAEAAQRASEEHQAAGIQSAAENYQKGKADAERASDKRVADLVAGNVRLRDQWATCRAATGVAVSAASGGQRADGEAGLRAAGVGRVLRIVGQCQAQRDALQQALIAERAQAPDAR